jgi:hypothetical protein
MPSGSGSVASVSRHATPVASHVRRLDLAGTRLIAGAGYLENEDRMAYLAERVRRGWWTETMPL